MGSFTKRGKEILMTFVSDCMNYGFTEKETLSYIKARLGKEISKDVYYRRKRLLTLVVMLRNILFYKNWICSQTYVDC